MPGDANWGSVKLLLHGNGANGSTTIVDSGPDGRTVTVSGNAQISTAQSKFGGSSLSVDGTGDSFNVTGPAIGTSDFTVEGFIRVAAPGSSFAVLDTRDSDLTDSGFAFYVRSTQKLTFGTGASFTATEGTTNVAADTWLHVALTRSGGTVRGFLDGNLEFTVSDADNFSLTAWKIGNFWNVGSGFSAGYIDDLRVTVGVARYTASFTPPAAQFPDGMGQVSGTVYDETGTPAARTVRAYRRDTGALVKEVHTDAGDADFDAVALLLHFDGADSSTAIVDSSRYGRTISVFGNAKISTTESVFGGASLLLDGSGDYLSIASAGDFNFGTGDFSIELRARRTGAGTGDRFLIDRGNGGSFLLRWSAAGALQLYLNATLKVSYEFAFTLDTWYDIKIIRSAGTVALWIDGVSVGSSASTENISSTAVIYIGAYPPSGTGDYFQGYIDELRISSGVARSSAVASEPFSSRAATAVGTYEFYTPTLAELTLLALDDATVGTIYNDIVERVIPA